MALEQHSGFWTYGPIEVRNAAGDKIIFTDANGNIFIDGRYLQIT